MNFKLIDKVRKLVNQFIKEYQKNPFHYLYEADIQHHLFMMLRENINDGYIFENKKYKAHSNHKEFDISLINSEYLRKIDIVCLDPKKIDENKDLWKQPVLVGIELKFVPFNDNSILWNFLFGPSFQYKICQLMV